MISRVKPEPDDACYNCSHYTRVQSKITDDPYTSSPGYTECDKDWECPEYEECGGPGGMTCYNCEADCEDRISCDDCPAEKCKEYVAEDCDF
jgi:hypothetical protein